eukprot:459070-Pleurochrysis_carterae.AAC.4
MSRYKSYKQPSARRAGARAAGWRLEPSPRLAGAQHAAAEAGEASCTAPHRSARSVSSVLKSGVSSNREGPAKT